jgi:hypothetical protein
VLRAGVSFRNRADFPFDASRSWQAKLMSERWLYRRFGQEFGPVSLDLVRTLVAAGTIAPDDEVRDEASSNWILACAASELRGSIRPPGMHFPSERRSVRDEWFCRRPEGEVGPLKLSDLIQLAADGLLEPHVEVKAWADDYWKEIRSIERLAELLPFSDAARLKPAGIPFLSCRMPRSDRAVMAPPGRVQPDEDIDNRDIILFPGVQSTIRVNSSAAGHSTEHGIDSDWWGWIAGREFGPVDFTQLSIWAVTGQLSPLDFVRRGQQGHYVPAVSVSTLFVVRAASDSRLQTRPPTEIPAEAELNDSIAFPASLAATPLPAAAALSAAPREIVRPGQGPLAESTARSGSGTMTGQHTQAGQVTLTREAGLVALTATRLPIDPQATLAVAPLPVCNPRGTTSTASTMDPRGDGGWLGRLSRFVFAICQTVHRPLPGAEVLESRQIHSSSARS